MTRDQEISKAVELGHVLAGIMTYEGVVVWMDTSMAKLNNATPRQFIEAGDIDRVLEVAYGYRDVSYT